MPNNYFHFKEFSIIQNHSGIKVTTDGCLFGAWIAKILIEYKEPKRVLDIGTGTGLLSLILAQNTNRTLIDGIEINKKVQEEAKFNFASSLWHNRLNAIYSKLQQFYPSYKYDIIVCNPPFFKKNLKGNSQTKNLAIHDDHLSMRDLIEGIARLSSEDSLVFIMYPQWEMDQFISKMKQEKWTDHKALLVRNKENQNIMRKLVMFNKDRNTNILSEIVIRDESNNYTEGFNTLLHPYYLEPNENRKPDENSR